jgi:hypothetical protein
VTNCINCVGGGRRGGSFSAVNMDIDFRYKYVIHRDGYMEWAIKLRNAI